MGTKAVIQRKVCEHRFYEEPMEKKNHAIVVSNSVKRSNLSMSAFYPANLMPKLTGRIFVTRQGVNY